MLIRREQPGDEEAIRGVHALAFQRLESPSEEPPEAALVEDLRASEAWVPQLSLVAVKGPDVIGHVVCSRASLGALGRPVLGLAPLGVHPDHQGIGVGHALMHAVLGAADALEEPLVGLVGEPAYYARFGFEPAQDHGVEAPEAAWGRYFQVRTLSAYEPAIVGRFTYAAAFGLPG